MVIHYKEYDNMGFQNPNWPRSSVEQNLGWENVKGCWGFGSNNETIKKIKELEKKIKKLEREPDTPLTYKEAVDNIAKEMGEVKVEKKSFLDKLNSILNRFKKIRDILVKDKNKEFIKKIPSMISYIDYLIKDLNEKIKGLKEIRDSGYDEDMVESIYPKLLLYIENYSKAIEHYEKILGLIGEIELDKGKNSFSKSRRKRRSNKRKSKSKRKRRSVTKKRKNKSKRKRRSVTKKRKSKISNMN